MGVVHHHVDDGAAVVHHGQQFRLGLPGGVEAGHCPDQPGGLSQFIPPGGGHNVQPRRPEQGDVPHDDLPAHGNRPARAVALMGRSAVRVWAMTALRSSAFMGSLLSRDYLWWVIRSYLVFHSFWERST